MAIRVPGIIVRVNNDTGIVAPPGIERFPAIIGAGDPYRLTADYRIRKGVDDYDSLGSTTTVNEIISAGDLPGISHYIETTDYTLVGNSIHWVNPAHKPAPGDYYYVTYTDTRPASAYTPMLYFDENLVYADHGGSMRTNGAINDVSVGGSLALNAGANGVIIAQLDLSDAVDPDSPTNSELETAFIATRDALEKISGYKLFLIPMSSGTLNTTSAANIFFNHAVICSMPERKLERTCIAALPKGTDYQDAATFAESYFHERMVVPAVPECTVSVVGFSGDFDTRFYNAVLGGKLCSVAVANTISDEILPNITFTDNFTIDEQNYLVQRGVSPGKVSGEVVRNVLAITSNTTNALTEDLGVQDAADYTKKYCREGLFELYKNKPINNSLMAQVNTSLRSMMEQLISDNVLSETKNITATQDVAEPRKINVTGKAKPAFRLQWMDITFTFALSFNS